MIPFDINELKKSLSPLSVKELKEIHLYISFLMESKGKPRDNMLALTLLGALNKSCYPSLKWPEFPSWFPSGTEALFWKLFEEVEVFLGTYCQDLVRSQHSGFLETLMKIKYEHIKKKLSYVGAPFTIKTFLQDKTTLEALIDNAYPAYLKAGNIRILYPKIR